MRIGSGVERIMNEGHGVIGQPRTILILLYPTEQIIREIVWAILVFCTLGVLNAVLFKLGLAIFVSLPCEVVETIVVKTEELRQTCVLTELPLS